MEFILVSNSFLNVFTKRKVRLFHQKPFFLCCCCFSSESPLKMIIFFQCSTATDCKYREGDFFFLLYLLYLEANCFEILWWFLPYTDMNQPCVYMCLPVLTPPSASVPIPFLWVVPAHQLQVPCFMNRSWTGFTDGNVHVSVLFSQVIPPSSDFKEHSNASCNLSCHIVVPMARNTQAVRQPLGWVLVLHLFSVLLYDPGKYPASDISHAWYNAYV